MYWRALIVIGVDGVDSHGVGGLVIVLLVRARQYAFRKRLELVGEVHSFTLQNSYARQASPCAAAVDSHLPVVQNELAPETL